MGASRIPPTAPPPRMRGASMLALLVAAAAVLAAARADRTCTVCGIFVTIVKAERDNGVSGGAIWEQCNNGTMCSRYPSFLHDACGHFMSNNAGAIKDQLNQHLDHMDGFCFKINACTDWHGGASAPIGGDLECSLCEKIVLWTETLLVANHTLADIERVLDDVCDVLPEDQAMCKDLVSNWVPTIVDQLVADVPPELVCTTIDLCPK